MVIVLRDMWFSNSKGRDIAGPAPSKHLPMRYFSE
jgi:hypothetical protein